MGIRLLLAAIFGGAIGYEREQAEKPAGLRTLMLVCVGAALFTLISVFGFEKADPARVAAQVVTGIGFLGAGTILRTGVSVQGITTAASIWVTAASIWVTAAVGMSLGVGMYIVSAVTTILAVVVLHFLPPGR